MNILGKDIDEFIMGVGTGGCFSGNSEIFKEMVPGIRCIAIEPVNVRSLSGGNTAGSHKLEGIAPRRNNSCVTCSVPAGASAAV